MSFSKGAELNYRNRALSVVVLLIALGIAYLGGYAAYCFLIKFGE